MTNVPTTLVDKAQKFVDDGAVTRIKGGAYIVVGSTGTPYSVWLAYPAEVVGNCECPSTAKVCSHLLAAAIFHGANPPEVVELADKQDAFRGLGI